MMTFLNQSLDCDSPGPRTPLRLERMLTNAYAYDRNTRTAYSVISGLYAE